MLWEIDNGAIVAAIGFAVGRTAKGARNALYVFGAGLILADILVVRNLTGLVFVAVVAAVSLGVVVGPRMLAWLGVGGGGTPRERTLALSGGSSAVGVVGSSAVAGSKGPVFVEATTTRTQLAAWGYGRVTVHNATHFQYDPARRGQCPAWN